jgi:hypothetical protein
MNTSKPETTTIEMTVEGPKRRGRKVNPDSKRQTYLKEKAERDVVRAQKRAARAETQANRAAAKEAKRLAKESAKVSA